jgi:protein subunit release factor B
MLKISEQVIIPSSEIDISAVRSSGAGGQNVNKVSTAPEFGIRKGGSSKLRMYTIQHSHPNVYFRRIVLRPRRFLS